MEILYTEIDPEQEISPFIKRFWKYRNPTENDQNYTILPDGHFDLIIKISNELTFNIFLFGIYTRQLEVVVPGHSTVIGICFKPLATEYILRRSIAGILNGCEIIENDFWGIHNLPFNDFNCWTQRITLEVKAALRNKKGQDSRKEKIFELLLQFNHSFSVQELSDYVYWNTRQINRYFQSRFGLSLKAYINILRVFRSYSNIRTGELSPSINFYDQSHFIKEIKKHTGVKPLELYKNENDRFLQFMTLPRG